jgi:hypothetical protein
MAVFGNKMIPFESAITFDADYQAILDYATTQGYTLPSPGQQIKQNTLLSSLKTLGIWGKLDSFANFATDGNFNFALIDWKNLTQYTAVNSPTFTSNVGFLTNGTNSYINTNKAPGPNFILNSASEFKWVNNNIDSSGGTVISGARSTSATANLYEVNPTSIFVNSNVSLSVTSNNLAGFRHLNRANSTQIQRFVNGVGLTGTQASTVVVNRIPFIGALNAGSATGFETNSFSIYGFGGNLSAEATDFYNAINTYITSL